MGEFKIIVIGASQGGVDALERLVAKLRPQLNAAVFIVLHIGSSSQSRLPELLGQVGPMPAAWARHAEAIRPGRIYVAPPDLHMVLAAGYIRLVHGAKENHTRPAVDPLFRSAALVYGPVVIGVVLSGNLDNGTAGLLAIKDCGGTAIVQDPTEAEAPSMPRSALHHVPVDYRSGIDEIGPLLVSLTEQGNNDPAADPPNAYRDVIVVENEFADGATASEAERHLQEIGIASSLSCPECRAVLFEIRDERALRFRCKVGHAFSAKTLLRDLAAAREDALWSALRSVQEEAELARRLVKEASADDEEGTAQFLAGIAERGDSQDRYLREILASASDLIEPADPRLTYR